MVVLVAAFRPIWCEEIPDTGSATGDRGLKDRLHRVIQLVPCGLTEATDLSIRVQSGTKQNLVRVDIPDARNDLLMHQQGFEAPAPTLQHPDEFFPSDGQRVVPEAPGHIPIKARLIDQ
jgi:hypothetical protein